MASAHNRYNAKKLQISLKLFFCGASWDRTSDTRIFSPLLYRLSYRTIRFTKRSLGWGVQMYFLFFIHQIFFPIICPVNANQLIS